MLPIAFARAPRALLVLLAIMLLAPLLPAQPTAAAEPWNQPFRITWQRTDQPVARRDVNRTWMWGPQANTGGVLEPYVEGKNGQRTVQYYDKTRMEITTDPSVPRTSIWYVTNGLLARELITGQRQIGDREFAAQSAAFINVAGDANDQSAPTYANFAPLLTAPAAPAGSTILQRIYRSGPLGDDAALARYGVTAARRVQVPGIDHQVASPFWEFMNSRGLVVVDGTARQAALFPDPFYATGYPITEAYWTRVRLAGVSTDVLVQCFERRCLTYTPSNPEGWKVEAGNVGAHYFQWRYAGRTPTPAPVEIEPKVIVLDPGHERGNGGALGIEYIHTLRTAQATKTALEAAGYIVYLTRNSDSESLYGDPVLMPSNAARMDVGYNQGYAHTTRALQLNPDLYISLHYNAAGSASVGGMTIYYCDNGGPQNATLARFVRDELRTALRSVGYEPPYAYASEDSSIGKVYGDLATLGNTYSAPFVFTGNRLVGIPAVLTEPLFFTNPTELALMDRSDIHRVFAAGYVRAVNAYFGR